MTVQKNRPSVLMRPRLRLVMADGIEGYIPRLWWMAEYGEHRTIGRTVEEAMRRFDYTWQRPVNELPFPTTADYGYTAYVSADEKCAVPPCGRNERQIVTVVKELRPPIPRTDLAGTDETFVTEYFVVLVQPGEPEP